MALFDVTDPMGRRQINLPGDVLTFGRRRVCSLQLRDQSCSRSHFEIHKKSDGYWLKDLGSRNKTQINGKPVLAETKLNNGDVIKAGRSRVVYEPSEATRAAPTSAAAGTGPKAASPSALPAGKPHVPPTKPSAPPAAAPKPFFAKPPLPVSSPPDKAQGPAKDDSSDDATRMAPPTLTPLPAKPPAAVNKLAGGTGIGVPQEIPKGIPIPPPKSTPRPVQNPVKPAEAVPKGIPIPVKPSEPASKGAPIPVKPAEAVPKGIPIPVKPSEPASKGAPIPVKPAEPAPKPIPITIKPTGSVPSPGGGGTAPGGAVMLNLDETPPAGSAPVGGKAPEAAPSAPKPAEPEKPPDSGPQEGAEKKSETPASGAKPDVAESSSASGNPPDATEPPASEKPSGGEPGSETPPVLKALPREEKKDDL